MIEKILEFDKRASDYAQKTNLATNTYKGDVETAYTMACVEQFELDRTAYMCCINSFYSMLIDCIELIDDTNNIDTNTVKYREAIQHELNNLPYMMRRLSSGGFLQTIREQTKQLWS